MNFSHLSHSSHVQTRKLCSSKYSKGKNTFSSFLRDERRRPLLLAGVALPTAQYHNCVVFNISERTEHALDNILYREKVLYIRIIEKLKENLSVLKIFPASQRMASRELYKAQGGCSGRVCTQLRSSWMWRQTGDGMLNATLWQRKGWTGMSLAVLAESTRVSGFLVQQHNGFYVAHSAALSGWLSSAQPGRTVGTQLYGHEAFPPPHPNPNLPPHS